jgi:hypothetical protein
VLSFPFLTTWLLIKCPVTWFSNSKIAAGASDCPSEVLTVKIALYYTSALFELLAFQPPCDVYGMSPALTLTDSVATGIFRSHSQNNSVEISCGLTPSRSLTPKFSAGLGISCDFFFPLLKYKLASLVKYRWLNR